MKPATIGIHGGYQTDPTTKAVAVPIYQTVAYEFDDAQHGADLFNLAVPGNIYTRIMNPTTDVLEKRIAELEGGIASLVVSSGSAAINYAILTIAEAGSNLVSVPLLYGGTYTLFAHMLPKLGIQVRFAQDDSPASLEALIDDKTVALFAETIGNPAGNIVDIEGLAAVAHKHGVPFIIDNTVATPILTRPIDYGADIVVHSLTKYIGGHSDVIAGAVLGYKNLIQRVKVLRTFLGNMISPNTSWLLLRSLETLKVRMTQQAINAEKVAAFLISHPKVEKVYYHGLENNTSISQQNIFKKQCVTSGAMLSFDIKGNEKEAFVFINNLNLIHLAVSLGGTESLVEHPFSMTHADVPSEEKNNLGLTEKMIRLSVGIENSDDLIHDIRLALEKV